MKAFLALALIAPAALAQVRVEPRLFVKDRHWFLSGGLSWLERSDYYNSPGFAFTAAYYPRESDAVQVRAIVFASWLGASGDEVVRGTGLVPDSHRPVSLLTVGWRRSLTYGKVALSGAVLHFDVQGGADVGTLITDRAWTPAATGFLGIVGRLGDHFFGQLDLVLIGSLEQRSSTVAAFGVLPLLTLGGWL